MLSKALVLWEEVAATVSKHYPAISWVKIPVNAMKAR